MESYIRMAKNITILNELMEISPVVAGLTADHPFKVPEGYFDQLPEKLLQLVRKNPEQDFPILSKGRKVADPFNAPEGYFDNLADNILNRIHAASASPSEELELLSPVLSKLDKKLPFAVPEGYFSEMSSNVVAGIKAIDFVQAELEILPPQLLEVQQKNVFTVPEGYFEDLPAAILEKVKPKTKIFSINFPTRVVRYAAAAVVIGIMAIGVLFFNREPETNVAVNSATNELGSSIKNVSDADIANYVENSATTLAEPATVTNSNLQQEDVKDMLADVSDTDIEMYLERYGISKKELTN